MRLADDLARALCRVGPEIAAIQGATSWSYDDLAGRVSRRVTQLAAQGLSAGQLVLLPVCPALDFLVMQHALARLGCGLFPVSGQNGEEKWDSCATRASVEWAWRLGAGRGVLESTGLAMPAGSASGVQPALLVETSGSDGAPKAVMLTPGNVLASARGVVELLKLGSGDCWLCCLPRTHVGGLMIAYRCAIAGATILVHERFDAEAVARDLGRCQVTHLSLVPAMLAQLMEVAKVPPACLRVLLVGGQSLSGVLADRAIAAGWPLRVTYGMTETASQIATSGRLSSVPEPGYAGSLLPGIQVRGGSSPAAPTLLRICGDVVMAGYANRLRAPGDGLEDGWLVTQDIGYVSDRGDLSVLGRADDQLVIGGELVLPSLIEHRMASAPGILSVVVMAFKNPVWGYLVVAAYTGEVGRKALDIWCRENLLPRERPREYVRIAPMPLLETGKPDRRRVRDMVALSLGLDAD